MESLSPSLISQLIVRYRDRYRAGFTIALAIHSFDSIRSLDLT